MTQSQEIHGGEEMLVLSRKLNESIVIDDNITITVVGIKGHTIRLGIEAPQSVAVHRQEIYEKLPQTPVPKSRNR